MARNMRLALSSSDMCDTGHDAANRAAVKQHQPEVLDVVGLALRDERKTVDQVVKGARMHP